MPDIADNRHVDTHGLVDRGRIDIDMDLLGIRRKRIDATGNTVIETRADADHDIAIMHRHIGFVGTVHAQHAEPVLAGSRIGAETHQRRGDREIGELDQFTQQTGCLRTRIDDAAAGVKTGFFAFDISSMAA